jgi:hypothetical protein
MINIAAVYGNEFIARTKTTKKNMHIKGRLKVSSINNQYVSPRQKQNANLMSKPRSVLTAACDIDTLILILSRFMSLGKSPNEIKVL